MAQNKDDVVGCKYGCKLFGTLNELVGCKLFGTLDEVIGCKSFSMPLMNNCGKVTFFLFHFLGLFTSFIKHLE